VFVFASLQSDIAAKLLKDTDTIEPFPDSILVIHKNKVFMKSEAALLISSFLPFPWRLITVGKIFPVSFSNVIYDWIARNRYKWFGKKDFCMMPEPGIQDKFL
jgi:predicted DCC family thiol-disulfide oxidoreductase YuxK